MRRRTTRPRAAAALALAVIAVDLGITVPAGAGAPPPARTCGPVTVEPAASLPASRPSVAIDSVAPPAPAHATATVDMDGDQVADTVSGPTDGTLTIARADGVLTLTDIPPSPPYPGFPASYSQTVTGDDLDGDGRQELVVTQGYVPGFQLPYRYDTWIVRGTTAPATLALAEAGLAIRGRVVGDIDDDGRDDLLLQGLSMVGQQAPDALVAADHAMAGPDPDAISPSVQRIGARADLDLDGAADQVRLGSTDATAPPGIAFSGAGLVELDADPADLVELERSDARTYVRLQRLLVVPSLSTTPETTSTFRVRATCAEGWMRSVVPFLAGRAPRTVDYPTFGPDEEPDLAARRQRMAAIVRSQTARGHLVDDSFVHYLGRPADPTGRAWWVAQLRAGRRTPERMFAELLGSPERFRRSGDDPLAWVDASYPLVYGRSPDPGGRAYWARQVAALGPARTAARMSAEPAARRHLARRHVTDVDAFGPSAPAWAIATAIATLDDLGFDGMLTELTAGPELYLLANERNHLA